MFAFRDRTFMMALALLAAGAGGADALLPSAAMAADLQLIIRPAARMAPMRTDSPASASSCSSCIGECRRRGAGPQCEAVCLIACKDR